jgi:hypothetical protein
MYVVKRTSATGGFNVRPTYGSVKRLFSQKTQGQGVGKKFYEETNVSHPFKSLGRTNVNKIGEGNSLSEMRVKSSRPKKYISLNL